MPIQLFQIFLDKQNEAYLAGEQVTGKFVIIVTDSYVHNGIYLKVEGHAIIKWTEDSNCFQQQLAKQQRARKQFFENVFKYASEETLSEGTHIFPFEYTLPSKLPSSLSTPTITIWYKMEALLQKEPKPRREVLVFPVQGVLDMNSTDIHGGGLQQQLSKSLSEVKSKSMLAFYPPCLCSFNYTSIGVRVAQQGFIPGDEVTVNLAVQTDCQFTFVSLSLIQEIMVMTKEKTMIERRTTVKLSLKDLIPEDDSDDYRRWNENLVIPADSVVSSNTTEYSDVKINYFIRFSAEATKFPYKAMQIQVPITIGSVALTEVVKDSDSIIPDGNSDIFNPEEKVLVDDDHEPELEICNSESETVQHHPIITPLEGKDLHAERESHLLLPDTGAAVASQPPKIVVDYTDLDDAETISSSTGMPSLDSNFLNSLENSMIKVVPIQLTNVSKIPTLPPVAASTSTSVSSAAASPQKGVLRRVSVADSTGGGNSSNTSPAKRLAFQETSDTTSPRKSSPKMVATTSQPKKSPPPSTPSPPSFAFSTSF